MKKASIGIYDKWLHTMGGGEKVATAMAEILSKKGYKVDLIASTDLDKGTLEQKMGVDLSKVSLTAWYERSYSSLEKRTRLYDLFINISFLDHLPSKAKKSLYYILFPAPVRTTLLGFIKYKNLLPLLRNLLIIPEIVSGVGPLDEVYTRTGRWLGQKNTMVLHNTPKECDITFRVYANELLQTSIDKVTFSSPNSQLTVIDKYIEHQFNVIVYKVHLKTEEVAAAISITVDQPLKNAFGLVSVTVKDLRFLFWNLLKRYFPRYEMALYGSSLYLPEQGLDTYDLFLADSQFSQYWTTRYLEKESIVLYPPVDITDLKPGKKKNIILSVGRFFVGGHAKRQDVLVNVFKHMLDTHQIPKDWELHFVGGLSQGQEHSDYLASVQASAQGYPIYFHLSADYQTLKKLYAEAKLYWHATGFGVDEKKEPIRTEHFGITPVEAMAAGAVPLLYNAGGLPEIVEQNQKLLWSGTEELIHKTQHFINHPEEMKTISSKMTVRARDFSKESFIKQLDKHLQQLGL